MKSEIRFEILNKRNAQSAEEIIRKSLFIENNLFSIEGFAKSIVCAFYASFRSEVSTYDMMSRCMDMNKRIFLPITIKPSHELIFSEIKSLNELKPNKMGIPEPGWDYIRPIELENIDSIIIPGVAFDLDGYRIGYGGGYYDRLIKKLPSKCLKIGLAFESQIIDSVPKNTYDMSVDMIVTEDRIIKISMV